MAQDGMCLSNGVTVHLNRLAGSNRKPKLKNGSNTIPLAGSRLVLAGHLMPERLKRPRDPMQLGKLIGDILTGQVGGNQMIARLGNVLYRAGCVFAC